MGLWEIMTAQRTWWHLEGLKKKPSDYDISTSKLLYYTNRGFEVHTPSGEWLLTQQKNCPLQVTDWEQFRDPRETTYTKYTMLQNEKEIYVDGLLRSVDETGYDQRLTPQWLATLSGILGPILYPTHGLQMIAAYVGHIAPSGRLVVTCALQAADEMRRTQRFAYRLRQIQITHPKFAQSGKALWQEDPMWQPMRMAIEKLLVTYAWGETITALNLVLKPAFDALFLTQLACLAERSGDEILTKVLASLEEDTRWHREWMQAFVTFCITESPKNAMFVQSWIEKWVPICDAAIAPFLSLFETKGASVRTSVRQLQNKLWREAGLEGISA